PGQKPIQSHVDTSHGVIDLYVPLGDVGSPPVGATLYSVTAHTVSQAAPAGPFTCTTRDANGNNQDPSGQVFNVYDKSAAYPSIPKRRLRPCLVAAQSRRGLPSKSSDPRHFTRGACQLRPIPNVYLVNGGSAAAERWALIYSEGEGSTTRDPATGTRLFPQGGGGPFADPECRRDLKNRYVEVKE